MKPSPDRPLPDPKLAELLERSGEIRIAAGALIRQMNELAWQIQQAKASRHPTAQSSRAFSGGNSSSSESIRMV